METYLNEKQEGIINCINDFLKDNKVVVLKDTNTTDCANIESVAEKIKSHLSKNGFNLYVSRYFNGNKLSNSKLEILDDERKPLCIYINTRKKVIEKRRESDDKITTMKQYILGEIRDVSMKYVREYITYKYNLSLTYDYIVLS